MPLLKKSYKIDLFSLNRFSRLYLHIYLYVWNTNQWKETMNLEESKGGAWKGLEGGSKQREEYYCN